MREPAPIIGFHSVDAFPGWDGAAAFLRGLVQRFRPARLLEIGSGANPTLDASEARRLGVHYITSDADPREVAKARSAMESRIVDAEHGPLPADLLGTQDMVFTRMVNEHIGDGRAYHRNIRALLSPTGIAVHCYASLFALPFVVNAAAPSWLSLRLWRMVGPRDEHRHGKFKAHYSWCRGPSARMIRRFQSLGYRVVEFHGYFGHNYYRRHLPFLDSLERVKTRILLSHPLPGLSAYAVVILQRARRDGRDPSPPT